MIALQVTPVFGAVEDEATDLFRQLDSVRAAIEGRFTAAGETLAGAYDLIEQLITSLDGLMAVLDEEKSRPAVGALRATAEELLTLPDLQKERGRALGALAGKSARLSADIETMATALRYMQVFSVNLKITAAGAVEFAGFADEMQQSLAAVDGKLDQFGEQLAALGQQVSRALGVVRQLVSDSEQTLPGVVSQLNADAAAIIAHNREVSSYAAEIAGVSQQIAGNLAKALQALQIGDATRQRIEHVMNGLALAESLAPASRCAVLGLLHAQLVDLTQAFGEDAPRVTKALMGVGAEGRTILSLKQRLDHGRGAGFLRTLEGSVSSARAVVERVNAANADGALAGVAAARTAEALLANVDEIRAVRVDINAMALNTSLRCSRMGAAGKPPNVIALELRVCADGLEVVAEEMVRNLASLSAEADEIAALADGGANLGGVLDDSIRSIREAGDAADDLMAGLQRQGDAVGQAVLSLGDGASYYLELQTGLQRACDALGAMDREGGHDRESAEAVLEQIFATYTMVRERDLHRRLFPAPAASAQANEDALLDDVMF